MRYSAKRRAHGENGRSHGDGRKQAPRNVHCRSRSHRDSGQYRNRQCYIFPYAELDGMCAQPKTPNADIHAAYNHSVALNMTIAAMHSGKRVTFNEVKQEVIIS